MIYESQKSKSITYICGASHTYIMTLPKNIILLSTLIFCTVSCIDSGYDLDDLDMEMTLLPGFVYYPEEQDFTVDIEEMLGSGFFDSGSTITSGAGFRITTNFTLDGLGIGIDSDSEFEFCINEAEVIGTVRNSVPANITLTASIPGVDRIEISPVISWGTEKNPSIQEIRMHLWSEEGLCMIDEISFHIDATMPVAGIPVLKEQKLEVRLEELVLAKGIRIF